MKIAAIVVQVTGETACPVSLEHGFDLIVCAEGDPNNVDVWRRLVANLPPDIDAVGFFSSDETVEGPLDEAVSKFRDEHKRAALMPHRVRKEYDNGDGDTYRLRLLRLPLPEYLGQFLWPDVDPALLMGVVNYHGFVAKNVRTTGPTGFIPASTNLWGQAWHTCQRSHSFEDAAAIAAVVPYPDAYLTLSEQALDNGRYDLGLHYASMAVTVYRDMMHILPWQRGDEIRAVHNAMMCAMELNDFWSIHLLFSRARELDSEDLELRAFFTARWRARRKIGLPPDLQKLLGETEEGQIGAQVSREPWQRENVYWLSEAPPHLQQIGFLNARGVVCMSDFHAQEYRKTFQFMPADFFKVCPRGFVSVLPEEKRAAVFRPADGFSDVEERILARVKKRVDFEETSTDLAAAKVFFTVRRDTPYHYEPVLQAQSAEAVPVVAGVGCIPELVKGGYFFRPPITTETFEHAMSERIVHLLTHESDRKEVAEEGRKRVLVENTWFACALQWHRELVGKS